MTTWTTIHNAFCKKLVDLGYRPLASLDIGEATFGELDGGFGVSALDVTLAEQNLNGTMDREYRVRVTLTMLLDQSRRAASAQELMGKEEELVAALCSFPWYRGEGLRRVLFEHSIFQHQSRGVAGSVAVAETDFLVLARMAV